MLIFFSVLKQKVLIVLVGVPTTEKMTRIQCTALDLGTGLLPWTVMSQLLQEGQGQVLQEVKKKKKKCLILNVFE